MSLTVEATPSSEPLHTAILLIAHGSRQQSANDDLHELAARFVGSGNLPDRRTLLSRACRT